MSPHRDRALSPTLPKKGSLVFFSSDTPFAHLSSNPGLVGHAGVHLRIMT